MIPTNIFMLDPDLLGDLDVKDGTALFGSLLRCEATRLSLPLEHPADPGHLDHVGADSEKDAAWGKLQLHGFIRSFISRTASSIPVKRARLMMLWPMLSSFRWGRVLTCAMFT